jgi:hypothetical protein
MTMKEKLLVLCVFVMVIVAFVVTHIASHLAFVLENCFALILPVLRSSNGKQVIGVGKENQHGTFGTCQYLDSRESQRHD